MYYILKLKWFEYRLERLSVFIKLIVLTVPCVLLSVYMFYFLQEHKHVDSMQLQKLKKEISVLKTLEVQSINFLKVIQLIEEFTRLNTISITSLKENNKNLELKFSGDKVGVSSLIEFSEWFHNASKIVSLKIKENKGKFEGEINVSFNKFFKKEKLFVQKFIKPSIPTAFKLSAIIGSYVLINEKLLKINDKIGQYKIIRVERNRVILEDKSKSMVLELYEKIN